MYLIFPFFLNLCVELFLLNLFLFILVPKKITKYVFSFFFPRPNKHTNKII